jgi:hypothetical protein
MSADHNPSLLSWSDQFQADAKFVDSAFIDTAEKLVNLLPRNFEKYPQAFNIRRGEAVPMDPTARRYFTRAEVEMTATAAEVTSAPDDMQRLFLDLGIKPGDEIAIEVMMAKKKLSLRNLVRQYPERKYSITLVPTVLRPDLVGVELDYGQNLSFLKPGTPVHTPEPVNTWYETDRICKMGQIYGLLREGMVYDSYEEGTHASISKFRHKPHPYLATIYKASADWIVDLIDRRMS